LFIGISIRFPWVVGAVISSPFRFSSVFTSRSKLHLPFARAGCVPVYGSRVSIVAIRFRLYDAGPIFHQVEGAISNRSFNVGPFRFYVEPSHLFFDLPATVLRAVSILLIITGLIHVW
jgi:hypothetical protein